MWYRRTDVVAASSPVAENGCSNQTRLDAFSGRGGRRYLLSALKRSRRRRRTDEKESHEAHGPGAYDDRARGADKPKRNGLPRPCPVRVNLLSGDERRTPLKSGGGEHAQRAPSSASSGPESVHQLSSTLLSGCSPRHTRRVTLVARRAGPLRLRRRLSPASTACDNAISSSVPRSNLALSNRFVTCRTSAYVQRRDDVARRRSCGKKRDGVWRPSEASWVAAGARIPPCVVE